MTSYIYGCRCWQVGRATLFGVTQNKPCVQHRSVCDTKGFHFSTMCACGVFCDLFWVPCCRQFRLLLQRSWRQISRDKAASMARLMSNLSSAIIFGAIFWRMQASSSRGPPGHTFLCLAVLHSMCMELKLAVLPYVTTSGGGLCISRHARTPGANSSS